MCTVTISPLQDKNSFVLTSNRDEAPGRATLAPEIYTEAGIELLYPRDVQAGGTWLGISRKKRVICLLNGGFSNHQRHPSYKKSRGVVVKDLLTAETLTDVIETTQLSGVEPFTIVAADWQEELFFAELVWDGNQKHFKKLSLAPHIWSSSPLYPTEMKALREGWFKALNDKGPLSPELLKEFHFSAGKGDKQAGVIMDRGFVKTRSISQIVHINGRSDFFYMDLDTEKVTEVSF